MRLPVFKMFVLVLCLASLGAAPVVSRAACAIACEAESGRVTAGEGTAGEAVPGCCGGHEQKPAAPADETRGCDSNCHPMTPVGIEKPAQPLSEAGAAVLHIAAVQIAWTTSAVRVRETGMALHGPPCGHIQSVRLRL